MTVVPKSWYVITLKSSVTKVYGKAFGILHVPGIMFELCVWQWLFFKGARILSLTGVFSGNLRGCFSLRAHHTLLLATILPGYLQTLAVRWLTAFSICPLLLPNGAHDPPDGHFGFCLSLIYRTRKGKIEEVK